MGRPDQRQPRDPAAAAPQRGAVVLLTNGSTGRALYRSLFPILMRAWFGIGMPALRLAPSLGAVGDLGRFAGVYAWPDRRWEVTGQRHPHRHAGR
jgi:hypothetical protein